MAFLVHRSLAVPLWAVALCAVALAAPSRLPSPFAALLAVALIAATMTVIVRWLRRHTTGAIHVRTFQQVSEAPAIDTLDSHDTLDLVRTGESWRVPLKPSGHKKLKKS